MILRTFSYLIQFSRSGVSNSLWPRGLQHSQPSLSITKSQSLLKLMFIELMMSSNHLILCHPLLLVPSIFPSIRAFSTKSILRIRWPKYWSFRISSSNEYSGLISFRIDWFDLLAVQGTLKSFLQHHSSKASFFSIQPLWFNSHIHTWLLQKPQLWLDGPLWAKWCLCKHCLGLSAFLPRSKCLLIPWLQSPSAVILESKKIKSVTVSIVYPSICHGVMGPDAMILVLWMLSFKPAFHSSLSLSSRGSLVPLHFLP